MKKLKCFLAWCWNRRWKALNLAFGLITATASVVIAIESAK